MNLNSQLKVDIFEGSYRMKVQIHVDAGSSFFLSLLSEALLLWLGLTNKQKDGKEHSGERGKFSLDGNKKKVVPKKCFCHDKKQHKLHLSKWVYGNPLLVMWK